MGRGWRVLAWTCVDLSSVTPHVEEPDLAKGEPIASVSFGARAAPQSAAPQSATTQRQRGRAVWPGGWRCRPPIAA